MFRNSFATAMTLVALLMLLLPLFCPDNASAAGVDFAARMKALRSRMGTAGPVETGTADTASESTAQSGSTGSSVTDSTDTGAANSGTSATGTSATGTSATGTSATGTSGTSAPNPFITTTPVKKNKAVVSPKSGKRSGSGKKFADTKSIPLNRGWKRESDAIHKYRIQIPGNWQTSFMIDGTDRVRTFLSPDQNVSLRVRTFAAGQGFNTEIMRVVFEQKILCGGQLLYNETGNLGGVPASLAVYSGAYGNIPVNVVGLFLIRSGVCYIVWSMVPQNLFMARSAEIDSILATFEYLN